MHVRTCGCYSALKELQLSFVLYGSIKSFEWTMEGVLAVRLRRSAGELGDGMGLAPKSPPFGGGVLLERVRSLLIWPSATLDNPL